MSDKRRRKPLLRSIRRFFDTSNQRIFGRKELEQNNAKSNEKGVVESGRRGEPYEVGACKSVPIIVLVGSGISADADGLSLAEYQERRRRRGVEDANGFTPQRRRWPGDSPATSAADGGDDRICSGRRLALGDRRWKVFSRGTSARGGADAGPGNRRHNLATACGQQ